MNWIENKSFTRTFFQSMLFLLLFSLVTPEAFSQLRNPEDFKDMVIDRKGNTFVTGSSSGARPHSFFDLDIVTIKYDSHGNENWLARYNDLGFSSETPIAISLDKEGNVYIAGNIRDDMEPGLGPSDFLTIKYDSKGNEKWVARYNGLGNDEDLVKSLKVDSGGNVYVSGNTRVPLEGTSFDTDIITVKYDTNGNEVWVQQYNGPFNFTTTSTSTTTTTTTTPTTLPPNERPVSFIVFPTDDTEIGVGGSVNFEGIVRVFDGNPPLSFLWDFGGGQQIKL